MGCEYESETIGELLVLGLALGTMVGKLESDLEHRHWRVVVPVLPLALAMELVKVV